MSTTVKPNRFSQITAWAVASLFILGFFVSPVGAWTGPILGIWFVGTQKPRRGFLWMMAFSFVPHLIADRRLFLHSRPEDAFVYVSCILLAAFLAVLPYTFHRLVSQSLPGFISTLPFPLAASTVQLLSLTCLPTRAFQFLADDSAAKLPLLHVVKAIGGGPILLFISAEIFLLSWFASVVIWMWNYEFRASKIRVGTVVFATIFLMANGYGYYRQFIGASMPESLPIGAVFVWVWICPAGVLILSIWALLNRRIPQTWVDRLRTIALLQSPYTGNPLHVVSNKGREELVSSSGERFPIRNGIPVFLKPEDLSGDNLKYNHMYETIGGFYDDTQRVYCALGGYVRDAFFLSHLRLLEVKPGDSVLETSVGTGLNFKYLPCGVKLSGLDLSPEMLANCQTNLRRWEMDADLYLGNAESLPFADSSFDVVFHAGGINFFNDRAKAIREMIRVAKPGSLLLITDETEKHVKCVYEKQPGGLFRNRKEPVKAPIDLVPPEMQEIHLEELMNGKTYALTFRKPAAVR